MVKKLLTFISIILILFLSSCEFFTVESSNITTIKKSKTSEVTTSSLPLTPEYGIGNQDNLFGMCYLLEQRNYWGAPFTPDDLEIEVELMNNLGVKTVRHWMHCTQLMTDKDTLKEDACEVMHKEIAECDKYNMLSVGMNHHNFNEGVSTVGKIRRNLTKDSEYVTWLNDYYTTWYNLAKEFSEVMYWEIDNELNNYDFMFNAKDRSFFTANEMAAIATDMLYYASRAIHDANPNAYSVMGGLTDRMGLGKSNIEGDPSVPSSKWFLDKIYQNIESGEFGYFYQKESQFDASTNPDDYFDIVAWHPYVWDLELDKSDFVDKNNEIYQVVLDHEGKHKKVFITEVGCQEYYRGDEVHTKYIEDMYGAISESMPYVETLMYFHLFDYALTDSWGGASGDAGIDSYGLFYDPDPEHSYYELIGAQKRSNSVMAVPGQPKLSAYKYQELANGSGDLTLLVNYYKDITN